MNHSVSLAPSSVRLNLLDAPTSLTHGPVVFSWCPAGEQVAYRIQVTQGRDHLDTHTMTYDTGWVTGPAGAASVAVTPAGLEEALIPGRLYYAVVTTRLATPSGEVETPASAPLAFVLDTPWVDTTGIWAQTAEGTTPDFAFLRQSLTLPDDLPYDRVYLSVTATSPEPTRQFVYTMWVNGEEVGVGPCRLGKDPQGSPFLYYHTYDVTDLLRSGENVLAAVGYTTANHGFLCQLTAYDQAGEAVVLANSGRDAALWQTAGGDEIYGRSNSIGTNYFAAHACNVRRDLYPFGFQDSGYMVGEMWNAATPGADIRTLCSPDGADLIPDEVDAVTRYPVATPATVTPLSIDGDPFAAQIDLGREIIGSLRLTLTNPTDHPVAVTLSYGEQLNAEGRVKCPMNTSNCYRETWTVCPGTQTLDTLSMMAYRYVDVTGLPAALDVAGISGLELRQNFDDTAAELVTEDTLLQDMYDLIKHTVKVTTQDIYVDSQSRERAAYEGDLLINMTAAYAVEPRFAPGRLTTAYLLGHRTWPADYLLSVIIAAYTDYMATGDTRLLSDWYDVLKQNLFTEWLDETGLVHSPTVGAANLNAVLVDWPFAERDGYDMAVAYNTVLNALQVAAYRCMAVIAGAIGKAEDAADLSARADSLKAAMLKWLYDPATGLFCDGLREDRTPSSHTAQHATAFALYAGVYPDLAEAARMAKAMTADGRMKVSVYGAYFLLDGLYGAGQGSLANRLLLDPNTSDGARTWAYMLYRLGATVTAEAWCQANKPNMTLSHPWGAAPAHLLRRGVCGVTPTTPGYATVDITPCLDGVPDASMVHPTIRGAIRMAWKTENGVRTLTLDLPVSVTATLRLPGGRVETLVGSVTPRSVHTYTL